MATTPSGPPGLPRPKKSLSSSPPHSTPSATHPHIFSPAPSQPCTNWFQLLSSPSPSPLSFVNPANVAHVEPLAQGHTATSPLASHAVTVPTERLPSNLVNNEALISNIGTTTGQYARTNPSDPWARAHAHVCAHANDNCAACSISVTCCSCRSLRFTPGPPPSSPTPVLASGINRSRSASPTLFRDVGNAPTPLGFHDDNAYDDEAYERAYAECDTCDNSSCLRGHNEPASWTITVEQFDEGLEEFYDRTFRACASCNRSCKKTFLSHKIKARHFDNSFKVSTTSTSKAPTKAAASPITEELPQPKSAALPTTSSSTDTPTDSRPTTPLQVFSTVARSHRLSCSHVFSTCPTCSCRITCCGCNNAHTAPARLKLCCAFCSHYACNTCTTPFCCSCHKPWFPTDAPTLVLANRFRGGVRSTKSSKKGSGSSSSQSSGPGSLASARSAQPSPDPFSHDQAVGSAPNPIVPTQSSADEIDAFVDATIRAPVVLRNEDTRERSTHAPSPSSNLPPGSAPVFSRPLLPIIVGATEDIPTAVLSRVPSRAGSVASSTGDAGIANEPQPPTFPKPADPPAFNDVIGRIHRRFPLASLKVDDEDSRHFLARDNTQVDDIANETNYLLSSHTSWPSILYFIRDTMKFESIQGPLTDFQVVLSGLAEIWSDAASFDARELLRDMLDSSRLLPKAEKEIDRLEEVSARYRSERQAARTQLRTTEAELSRLRQAANDTLDSNARLLSEIDQLRATDAIATARERDEAQLALKDAIAHSKAAMAKQVSRYQHLATIADERNSRIQNLEREAADKDAYILKTEREHAEIYREREAAERLVTSLKQELQNATSLFETTREARRHDQEDFDERTTSFKKHISELNAKLNLLPAGEAELRSLVADANERAGIAEEEYRKKSAELKIAHKEITALKTKQAMQAKSTTSTEPTRAKPSAKTTKTVRWGFEPSDDAPSSQPFWDHSNEYSRYIASMVTATVTAIPSIPMQTAIATAIETVRAAGPAILSQSTTDQPSKAAPPPQAPPLEIPSPVQKTWKDRRLDRTGTG